MMTDIDILKNIPSGLPFPEISEMLLARDGVVSILPQNYKWREGDRVVHYTNNYGTTKLEDVPLAQYTPEFSTAENWLAAQGYSSMRLVALLDLEAKLIAANKTSPKMTAVRSWIDNILATFVLNPAPKNDWIVAPYTFEETSQEAFTTLST